MSTPGNGDGYAYLLDRLQADDFARLRAYAADGRARFSTWLVVVAQRLCIDFHRSRYGRIREAQDPGERAARRQLHDLVGDVIDIEALPGRTSSPDLGCEGPSSTAALGIRAGPTSTPATGSFSRCASPMTCPPRASRK